MITSEQLANGAVYGAQRKPSLIPVEFENVQAIDIDLSNRANVKQKPNLDAVWVPTSQNAAIKTIYDRYVLSGYRKATKDDIDTLPGGEFGCQIPWDDNKGVFRDGDTVLMVCPIERAKGIKFGSYLRANSPLWNEAQKREVREKMGIHVPERMDKSRVDRSTQDGVATSSDQIEMRATRSGPRN